MASGKLACVALQVLPIVRGHRRAPDTCGSTVDRRYFVAVAAVMIACSLAHCSGPTSNVSEVAPFRTALAALTPPPLADVDVPAAPYAVGAAQPRPHSPVAATTAPCSLWRFVPLSVNSVVSVVGEHATSPLEGAGYPAFGLLRSCMAPSKAVLPIGLSMAM
jgi:hypothetical protein